MMDDVELLRRYAEEYSEAAFTELVQRHLDLVYSTALRQLHGDTHLAQDVAQLVFTALARKATSLTSRTALAGWLFLSTHHAAAQVVRTAQRRHVREQEAHAMHELFSNADAATDWERVRPVLDDAMRKLGDGDREAVLLRYFECRPFADVGAALKLSEDAARMRVDRALEKLRVLLGRRGITSTTAALGAALGNQAMVAAPTGLATTISGAAIAGAANVGAGATFITGIFMTKTTATVSIVALLAISSAIYFFDQTHRAEADAAASGRERDALRAKLADSERRAGQAEQQSAALRRDLSGVFSNKATQATASTNNTITFSRGAGSGEATIEFSPGMPTDNAEVQRRLREMRAENIDAVYTALFHQLGFTAEQIELFKAVKIDFAEKGHELFKARMTAAKAENSALDHTAGQKIAEQTAADNYAETQVALRNAFGDSLYASIQHYESMLPVRPLANQLAASLFYSDSPLSPAQAEQLVEIMANQARNAQGKVDSSTMNSITVLEKAQTVLSPSQLTAFQQVVSQRLRKQVEEERIIDNNNRSSMPVGQLEK